MRPTLHLVPLALLAVAWTMAAAMPPAARLGPGWGDPLARLVVALFALYVAAAAFRVAGPALRARPRLALALGGGFVLAHLFASRAVAPTFEGIHAHAGIVEAFGPLAPWPALAFAAPTSGLAGQVTLGFALVSIALATVFAAATLAALDRRPAAACAAAWLPFGASACAGCAPLLALALGGAPALADPTSPWSALLLTAPPLLALALLSPATRAERPRAPLARRALLAGVALVLALPAASAQALEPAADSRQDLIEDLFVLAVIGSIALVGVVFVGVLWMAYAYRAREDEPPRGASWRLSRGARRWLVATYVGVPVLVVFGIGVASYGTLMELSSPPEETLRVDVQAVRFAWLFTMPDGSTSTNELRVEQGAVVLLNMTSTDVIHSLYVPQLGLKQDVTPGAATQAWFRAQEPGVYRLVCAEYCGVGHTGMVANITVTPTRG